MASVLTQEQSNALLVLCRAGRLYEIEDWIKSGKSTQTAPASAALPFKSQSQESKRQDEADGYSNVYRRLKRTANKENCDFPGFGLHSFRRANITWRQEGGGSAIEVCKIAGHSEVDITGEYTFVGIDRQEALTKAIQERLAKVASKDDGPSPDGAQGEQTAQETKQHKAKVVAIDSRGTAA